MTKQHGLTLIEMLMVLVVIAVILLLSIQRYRVYQRSIEMTGVKNDIESVQQALNRYYHIEGCNSRGVFPADKRSPSMTELGLNVPGRPPIVPIASDAYVATIVDTHAQKKTKDDKPLYVLQVTAKLNSHYTNEKIRWYRKTLGAERASSNTLTWTVLPSNTATAPGTQLWVLKSGAAQFRKMENTLREKLGPKQVMNSSSYCAH